MSKSIPVSATHSRPPGFPSPLSFAHNNLNPTLTIGPDGVVIKVVMTSEVPLADIKKVEIKKGLHGKFFAEFFNQGWDYIVHFPDQAALVELLKELRLREVTLGEAASGLLAEL